MIELEFLQSPDEEILGPCLTHANSLIIGTSLDDDIIIFDQEISPHHYRLEVTEREISGDSRKFSFLCNSKKISGLVKHLAEDQITLGQTTFKIKNFKYQEDPDSLKSLQKQYQQTVQKSPELAPILSALEQELLYLEHLHHQMPNKVVE